MPVPRRSMIKKRPRLDGGAAAKIPEKRPRLDGGAAAKIPAEVLSDVKVSTGAEDQPEVCDARCFEQLAKTYSDEVGDASSEDRYCTVL